MNVPDMINSGFEAFGVVTAVMNIRKILEDKIVRGIHWGSTSFFAAWGYWNMYYYSHLDQWWSFSFGSALAVANTAWVILAIHYRKNNN